jgi:NAD-dependent dihydropyrimidine dehydrogenase PreA subunit
MTGLRYLEDVITLRFDVDKCTGCQLCTQVCPHGVFAMDGNRAKVVDRGACMECGACALNCAFGAIEVQSGVGCAAAIIASYFRRGGEVSCGPDNASDAGSCGGSSGGCC